MEVEAYDNDRIYKVRIPKWHYNHINILKELKEGDQVILFNSRLRLFSEKLKSRWFGPYIVTEVSPHCAVEITSLKKGTFKVNEHRPKPYFGVEASNDDAEIIFLREPHEIRYGPLNEEIDRQASQRDFP
ncbi:uncharacterized protein LOC120271601 [Dioscorea cayenensis subsp. rotundata]|uniref:Uncharacterized protein LOC120271601 n=1 Tax=Dioscorea cayennensis subsp. rotundata TaxID=55577 RepID=A0AB40C4D3_DIOCR|nr:uncharacterized protein LOC120271601 [Dioscorea cayenensis subsp. rotundata]